LALNPNTNLVDGAVPGAGEDELSTAMTALVAGFKPPATRKRCISVAKMNTAGSVVPGTRNAVEGFHTIPVGAAGAGFGGLFGSTGCRRRSTTFPAADRHLSGTFVPLPL